MHFQRLYRNSQVTLLKKITEISDYLDTKNHKLIQMTKVTDTTTYIVESVPAENLNYLIPMPQMSISNKNDITYKKQTETT